MVDLKCSCVRTTIQSTKRRRNASIDILCMYLELETIGSWSLRKLRRRTSSNTEFGCLRTSPARSAFCNGLTIQQTCGERVLMGPKQLDVVKLVCGKLFLWYNKSILISIFSNPQKPSETVQILLLFQTREAVYHQRSYHQLVRNHHSFFTIETIGLQKGTMCSHWLFGKSGIRKTQLVVLNMRFLHTQFGFIWWLFFLE